jgi:hypothetical protein
MKNAQGQFISGAIPANWQPVGTVVIRTRHKRGGEQRAWVKIAEPNKWRKRAQVVWEAENGPIPPGFSVHHRDENKLNDSPDNLELLSKADHLAIHRIAFQDQCVAALKRARQEKSWSTKSATKRTGRHPKDCDCPLHAK